MATWAKDPKRWDGAMAKTAWCMLVACELNLRGEGSSNIYMYMYFVGALLLGMVAKKKTASTKYMCILSIEN